MCGIAGLFAFRSGKPASRATLQGMADALRHRGPDGEGFFVDGALGLAHRRLAVIDLEGGHQPMASADGSLVICYNGEVYNFVELGEELESLGHQRRTRSDTEVMLLAYAEWGLDFVKHLNGMFAFALWDSRARRLVLGRDRMGIKPLVFAHTSDGVAFASEIKALRCLPGVHEEPDLHALDEFMTCGYVLGPRSLVRGVEKLSPGTLMVFEADKEPRSERYWSFAFRPDHSRSVESWGEEIRETFGDAVRLRLRSDVPLGTLLSGGVDSTAIAATLAKERGDTASVHSYCIGVDIPGAFNEFDFARRVAKQLGITHHEQRLSAEQFGASLVEAANLMDEPLVEPMVGQLLSVCRFARETLTVALSGEGADETWFGYPGYRVHSAIEQIQRVVPMPWLKALARGIDWIDDKRSLPPRLTKYARLVPEPIERRYLGLNQFDTRVKDGLYRPEVRAALRGFDSREAMRRLYDDGVGGDEPLSRMAAVDCRAWLVDNTLFRTDLMSMASSLEVRVPFLDHRLVELATRVPARLKVRGNQAKVILKTALADRLPPFVVKRTKVGFPTPLVELFNGSVGTTAEELFRNPTRTTAKLFDHRVLVKMLQAHRNGNVQNTRVLFQMLMLEYWAQKFEKTA